MRIRAESPPRERVEPRGALKSVWVAAAVYGVAAVALTFPLAFSLTTKLGALQDTGDPYLNLWILGWGLRAWTIDPASVLSGRVFDANIFFPAEATLTYSDHFLLQALALSPLYALTRDPVLCYNVLLIDSIALSGLAMHVFTRAVTGSVAGAYVAGLAWACWPYRTAHLLHIQLQASYFMPLALLCLHRFMARRRWRDALALAGLTALQIVASVYYGVMTVIVLVVASLGLAIATGQWRARRMWTRLVVSGAATFVLTLPVLLPYVRSQEAEGFGRTLFEAATHSASWQAYSQVPPVNLMYGRTGLLDPRPPRAGARDRTHVEHQLFPGFVLMALAAFGLVRHRRDGRAVVITAAALLVVGLGLSWGPEGARGLYAALHDNVYGFQAIRAPGRFAVIAMLGLATLAAVGMRSFVDVSASPKGLAFTLAITALMCLEYLNGPLPLANRPPLRTEVGQWLAREPGPGAVVHVPLAIDIENTTYMVQSLEHGRPIVNGYSGQRPAFFSSLVDSLADLPSPTSFSALRDFEVRFVVSATPIAGAGHERSPLVERARLSDGVIYELRWTPGAVAALEDVRAPPPPPPGPAPFGAGEVVTYDVYWDGGPMNIPAGTATLTVQSNPEGGPGWTFETRATTANWVSTFFSADDRLITVAGADLLPIEHRREIREGRRRVDRRYLYNREAKTVQTGEMTLPLGSGDARDSLTTLYYVRSLLLTPGAIVTVPMNEAGTSFALNVAVAEVEEIEHHGHRVPALRLEPRITRRIERRRPIAMTLWLSADQRRVPLRALIEAGFGRIRLELREYRAR